MMPVSLMSFALAMPRAPTAAMKTIRPKLTNNITPLKRFLYGGLGVPGEDGLAVDTVRGEVAEAAPLLPPFSLKMKSPNKSSRNQTKIRIQRVPSGLFFVGHDANVWIDLYVYLRCGLFDLPTNTNIWVSQSLVEICLNFHDSFVAILGRCARTPGVEIEIIFPFAC